MKTTEASQKKVGLCECCAAYNKLRRSSSYIKLSQKEQ